MLLLRISLVVAILAGAGVIAVTQIKVKPHLESIINARNDFEQKFKKETKRANDLAANLKQTQGKLADTEKKLSDTETALAATKTQYENEQKRANSIQETLDKTKKDLTEAQQVRAAWDALGIPVEQVKLVIDSEKKMRAANEALTEENKVLNRKYKSTYAELQRYIQGTEVEPPLPAGLKGKVLVVDPKWDFVVLDIGEKNGVVANGVMLVSRESRLVGKIKIMNVLADRCIANILPGWKRGEVMEGDLVIY
jgi:protein-disulfide isomerase-like protein with CxxC motif